MTSYSISRIPRTLTAIFSGNKVQAPAFLENSSGVVTYNGDYGRLQINVSDVRRLSINTIGPELFSTADFAALDDLVTKLNGDNGSGIRGSISSLNEPSSKTRNFE